MSSTMMQRIILMNGHLRMTGHETRQELQEALLNLYFHDHDACMRPRFGTPVAAMIPDIAKIMANPGPKKKVTDIRGI